MVQTRRAALSVRLRDRPKPAPVQSLLPTPATSRGEKRSRRPGLQAAVGAKAPSHEGCFLFAPEAGGEAEPRAGRSSPCLLLSRQRRQVTAPQRCAGQTSPCPAAM